VQNQYCNVGTPRTRPKSKSLKKRRHTREHFNPYNFIKKEARESTVQTHKHYSKNCFVSVFGVESHRGIKIFQHIDKRRSYHLQGECIWEYRWEAFRKVIVRFFILPHTARCQIYDVPPTFPPSRQPPDLRARKMDSATLAKCQEIFVPLRGLTQKADPKH